MKTLTVLLLLFLSGCVYAQEWNPYDPLIKIPIDTKDPYERGMLEGSRLTILLEDVLEDQHMVFIDGEHCRSGEQEFCVYYSQWLLKLSADELRAFEPYNPRTVMMDVPEWPTDDEPRPGLKVRLGLNHP